MEFLRLLERLRTPVGDTFFQLLPFWVKKQFSFSQDFCFYGVLTKNKDILYWQWDSLVLLSISF